MYPWDGLIGKPHNIIRHPDMPKAVFWLLWETIKKGDLIGAYVKNRAKDGRYYWVFAIVTPIEGGYISVRLKPGSKVFELVQQEYKNLLSAERSQKLRPEESGEVLMNHLKELGFDNYTSFMSHALAEEVKTRNSALSYEKSYILEIFENLTTSSKKLMSMVNQIYTAYKKNKYVPLNLKIQAAQLGNSGRTIGVISTNYSRISDEIKIVMEEFLSSASHVIETINKGQFLSCTAKIQEEVLDFFNDETSEDGSPGNIEQEVLYLESQKNEYNEKASQGLQEIASRIEKFYKSCIQIKRMATGLEVTRIMGKVESARLQEYESGMNELISDLDNFQSTITEGLKQINDLNKSLQYNIIKLSQSKL
jgi:hypothetical protein